MTTIRDIARHIGVSEATVSRVLNGKGRVGDDTRKAILEYAQSVDYRPNQIAMRLKKQSSKMIGVVVPDISNEFYSKFYQLCDLRLSKRGYTPILFNTGESLEREGGFVEHLRSAIVDGLIIATSGSAVYAELPESIISRIVFVDNRPDIDRPFAFAGSNNEEASFQLTRHFADRGICRIATIMGPLGESSAQERLLGFNRCVSMLGLEVPDEWRVRTDFTYADGMRKARELLSAPRRPEGIIAQNNVLAYAAIRVAREQGLRVPDSFAVACFDHIDTYGFMRPVITSMIQPLEEISQWACDRLLEQLKADGTELQQIEFTSAFHLGKTS